MQEFDSWRDLLGKIVNNALERRRLARALRVNPTTLVRWATNKSHPRHDNLHALALALPRYRSMLLPLILLEYPDFTMVASGQHQPWEIPTDFYAHVISSYTNSPPFLRTTTVSSLIIQQILKQLDPQRQGLVVLVAKCVPPCRGSDKVRSIYLSAGRGSPPWTSKLDAIPHFYGVESQAGHALLTGHHITVNTPEMQALLYPDHISLIERSAVAYPILISDRTPGCLCIASTQPNFFTQELLDIIQAYTYLMGLAFEPEEFYDLKNIDMGIMPTEEAQKPVVATFAQRVEQRISMGTYQGSPRGRKQIEIEILQELEDELLRLAFHED